VATKRPILRYLLLAMLFAITVAYEISYLRNFVQDEKRDVPLVVLKSASNQVALVSEHVAKAGMRVGDRILAVNGVPYTGTGLLFDAFHRAPIGVPIALTVQSGDPSHPRDRTVSLVVTRSPVTFWDVTGDVVRHILLPGISILLGFWVAAQRPRDSLAWLLLALMLSFPHVLDPPQVEGWPPRWREAAMLYHMTLAIMFPVVMFLFGRFFPEPFARGSGLDKTWKVMQWGIALPYSVFAIARVAVSVSDLSNFRALSPLDHFFERFDHPAQVFGYILVGTFLAAIGSKYGLSRSSDAKRRLRILFWGAILAWTPLLIVILYPLVVQRPIADLIPQWAIVLILIPLVLFPLTLAYVIVQKAMGVGVALRQGLQYTFARSGIRFLQAAVSTLLIWTAITLASHQSRARSEKIIVIALGVAAIFTIRRIGDRLRGWTDRRFFREAYNAEQVLTELSDQVRTMVEPKSLLETVTRRIAGTLHIPRVAVLLGGDVYKPAYAVGYGDLSKVSFQPGAGTVRLLSQHKEPAHVHLGNPDSWVNTEEDVSDNERARLAELGSELLLPLAVRDKLLGFISLGPKKSEEPYSGSDVRLLKSVAAQTGLALENANLMRAIADEVAQRERLNREVEIAREVQQRLFPQKLPAIRGLDYAGHCRPALGVGGDYYDFLALPHGHLGVAIGDVSGKGIAAALMMASLQASLRGEATRAQENLAVAVANINRLVYEASHADRYATFFYGQYDPMAHTLTYVNAGHNAPMLLRAQGSAVHLTRLEVGGTVVGLIESFPYQQGCVTFVPGDLLVAFTDGISEAMNKEDEEWGEDRLIQTVKQCQGLDAKQILDRIFIAADSFVDGAQQHDDMTLVVLRVKQE
jgi:sigma-B regulation protein RsbU (phosphoserine phosphatase)